MHHHSSFTILPILLLAAANAAQEESSARRTRGLGGPAQHEYVSSEPLTFEVADPEPVDRDRLLAEAEAEIVDEDEHDYEVMEGMDLFDGEDEWVTMDGEEWDEEGVDFIDEEYVEDEDFDTVNEMKEGEPQFDSTYESEDGVEYFAQEGNEEEGDGAEEVGEPKDFNEPIARRLRRIIPVANQEMDEERYLAEKESFRDDSIPIFEPTDDENEEFDLSPYAEPGYLEELGQLDEHDGRDLQSACGSGQRRVKIEIVTDKSGYETSWDLRKGNGALVNKGPPGNTKYADSKRYVGGMCLSPGNYRFTVYDKFRDGMCGANTGRGLYRFYINGVKRFTSPSNCSQNWGKRVHTFTIKGSSNNNNNNNNAGSGGGGCSNVRIQFKVDKFGKETTVKLTGNGSTQLQSVKDVGAYQTKTMTKCVPSGTYTLRLIDQDGICCSRGQGWYKMFVNGQQVIAGGYFIGSKTHTIKIGSNWQSSMTNRDREWLNAHNSRRRKYNGGKGYVPLRWSRTLKSDAKNYAEQLGNNCKNEELIHAKGIQDGENLAKNKGSGSFGVLKTADQVMSRFVEKELNLPYPKNAHYTQVVWRATQYVGCGESVRNIGGGQMCRIQVCRYTRAGNCNVRNGNWRAEAWKDDTGCGRYCPREGCYI